MGTVVSWIAFALGDFLVCVMLFLSVDVVDVVDVAGVANLVISIDSAWLSNYDP